LDGLYAGQTAMLVGGAPSLREQPIELFTQRGVITMAMNNAAVHFRPTMWVSGDRPQCYDPQIIMDPTILKFAPAAQAKVDIEDIKRKYYNVPNILFYMQQDNVTWDEYLAQRNTVPWYNNTLFVGIHILYQLGVRRIILAGSDFGFGDNGRMYAHETALGSMEQKWNLDLYNSQVRELRLLKPVFERAGLTLMDSSKNSRVAQVYEHISLEKAVELCLDKFPPKPKDPLELPHCSKFAPESIQDRIAKWPGHQVIGAPIPVVQAPEGDMQSVL
jgi:hypothetical protein